MLADSLVEEFEIREDEPWYDQQDLQQGEPGRWRGASEGGRVASRVCEGRHGGVRAGAALNGACEAKGLWGSTGRGVCEGRGSGEVGV